LILEEDEAKMAMAPTTIGGNPVSFYVYVEDVDLFAKELESKDVQIVKPLGDMPWGDRCFVALDPEHHVWMFATHKVDIDM
jgi:PhnB protein